MGKSSGKTLAEYALILFLVVLVAIPALQMLGGAVSNLLIYGDAPSKAGSLFALLGVGSGGGTNGAAGGTGSNGSSGGEGGSDTTSPLAMNASVLNDSAGTSSVPGTAYLNKNGQPIVTVDTVDGTGLSTTSTNGGAMVTTNEVGLYSSFKLANSLEELAKEMDNPVETAYVEELAEYSYILGHAEGELDNVSGIALPGYNRASALQDVIDYSSKLNQALQNPPDYMDPQTKSLVQGLGNEVYSTSQQYTNALSDVIDANGKVTRSWNPTNAGYAGATYSGAGQSYNDRTDRTTLLDYGSYENFKQKADTLLENGTISSEPVKVTFTGAQETDQSIDTPRWRGRRYNKR